MNKSYINKLKMYKAVQQHCEVTQPDWNGMPAFVNAIGDFSLRISDLDQLAQEQSIRLLGIAAEKEKQRIETANAADALHGILIAHAKTTNNALLRELMRFPASQLRRGNAAKSVQLIKRIVEEANRYLPALSDYGVTPNTVADLEQRCLVLETSVGSTRLAIVDRSQITKAIGTLVREIDDLLNDTIDQLALALRAGHAKFYDRYKVARRIVDYNGKKKGSGFLDVPPDEG